MSEGIDEKDLRAKSKHGFNPRTDCIPVINTHFDIIRKIGDGSYGTVYLAQLKPRNNERKIVQRIGLKYILPTCHPSRIENEVKCLQRLGGSHNVIGFLFSVRHRDYVSLAMPYFPHDKIYDYAHNMTMDEIRDYMRNLFIALEHVHSHDIIHRDVKPSNFLYNRALRRYALIDFGLAQNLSSNGHFSPEIINLSSSSSSKVSVKQERLALPDENENKKRKHEEMTPEKKSLLSPLKKRVALSNITLNQKKDVRTNKSNAKENSSRPSLCKPLFIEPNETNGKVSGAKTPVGFTRLDSNTNTQHNLKISSLEKSDHTKFKLIKTTEKPWDLRTRRVNGTSQITQMAMCNCYGTNQVCQICSKRTPLTAPRGGTPGFRAPEVLLKFSHQTIALDMWSAGVILICFLTGRYPFFHPSNDMMALGEIISLFGTHAVKEAATKMGKHLTTSPVKPPLDLRKVCHRMRRNQQSSLSGSVSGVPCKRCGEKFMRNDCVCLKSDRPSLSEVDVTSAPQGDLFEEIPESAFHLLHQLLALDPNARISAVTALQHPFFRATHDIVDTQDFFNDFVEDNL